MENDTITVKRLIDHHHYEDGWYWKYFSTAMKGPFKTRLEAVEAACAFERECDLGEIAHWIAAPMKDVGTFEQFHEVVNRAEQALRKVRG